MRLVGLVKGRGNGNDCLATAMGISANIESIRVDSRRQDYYGSRRHRVFVYEEANGEADRERSEVINMLQRYKTM